MEAFTVEQLYSAALVFLALCGAVVAVGKTIEVIRGWRKPSDDLKDEVRQHTAYFAADKRRLDAHEGELEALGEGQKVCCIALIALLEHELHNGNTEEMQDASKQLNQWLVSRK